MMQTQGKEIETVNDFLKNALKFLAKYSWIYRAKNIDIFVFDVLEMIPNEWKEALLNLNFPELQEVPFNYCKDTWPKSLQDFIQQANHLAVFRHQFKPSKSRKKLGEVTIEIPNFIRKKTPLKKLKELESTAAVIGNMSLMYNCKTVLDVGSGLGYLDQVLHHNYGLTMIGLESVPELVASAEIRIKKGLCSQNMHFIHTRVENTDEYKETIKHLIKKEKVECDCGKQVLQNTNDSAGAAMMVGLHCCGNLAQDMMKLFCDLPEIKVFLCASCCYHKVNLAEFPMSCGAKSSVSTAQMEYPNWCPTVTGLRLGCQGTRSHWVTLDEANHSYLEKCLSYRAVLQSYLTTESLSWKKPSRHFRIDKELLSFEDFVAHSFKYSGWNETVKELQIHRLNAIFLEKQPLFPCIKILHLLQALLQPIWEGVIIADRLSYFKEKGIRTDVVVIADESVTPRNLVLCGYRL